VPFGHSALTVDAESDAADLRYGLQKCAQSIPAVSTMCLGVQAFDGVVGIGTVDPTVAMHPDAELEIDAPRDRLLADEAQHLQIAFAFRVRQLRHAHVIPRH